MMVFMILAVFQLVVFLVLGNSFGWKEYRGNDIDGVEINFPTGCPQIVCLSTRVSVIHLQCGRFSVSLDLSVIMESST